MVEQDYAAYDEVDQAVWRFVLLQLSSRLGQRAHPAYQLGLKASGISAERIPSIAEMNERLAALGWGAVCVDGFIPPRAFQEFQANGLLPIAAEVRTREHLVYTPAPDIIHEAAGHAPILADPVYAAYLRRVGELGARAFTLPEDTAVHEATHTLSEIKEDGIASPASVARAEQGLAEALQSLTRSSEATRLSRLYWWTAEYGLVGRPDDYRIYGAGLLSSLGESHSCHSPEVLKLPLDERCLDLGFDITRPQPQLFVARDFEALHELSERVEGSLARTRGGAVALAAAQQSRELSTLSFESGAQAIGVLTEIVGDVGAPALLVLAGPCAIARAGVILADQGPSVHTSGLCIPLGRLASGTRLEDLCEAEVVRRIDPSTRRLRLEFECGARVEGVFERRIGLPGGRTAVVKLSQALITVPRHAAIELREFSLVAAGAFVTAEPGASDKSFYEAAEASSGIGSASEREPGHAKPDAPKRVPRARPLSSEQRALRACYARVSSARGNSEVEGPFAAVEQQLAAFHPREWLLRFAMLEELARRGSRSALALGLEATLERLEADYGGEQPIASGLKSLRTANA